MPFCCRNVFVFSLRKFLILMTVWSITGKIIRTSITVTYALIMDSFRFRSFLVFCVTYRVSVLRLELFCFIIMCMYVHECKGYLWNDLYCVGQNVKPHSLSRFVAMRLTVAVMLSECTVWICCLFAAVNTPAAELLYTSISDLCQISSQSTVVDICCGTGTIALSLAKVRNL